MTRREKEDEDKDDIGDPPVAMVRADATSTFPDPRHARLISSFSESAGGWGEFDVSFLENTRAPVPGFPLDILPHFWRGWVVDTARSAGAPPDYVALALISTAAGLRGAGARVHVASGWSEPLVLWQALIGAPSSGKSPAIAPLRALLAELQQPAPPQDSEQPSDVAGGPLSNLADMAATDAKGAMLYCDAHTDWLGQLAKGSSAARGELLRAWSASDRCPLGLLACLQPEQVPQMVRIGAELAARFLFTWPHPPPYCRLHERKVAADGDALAALRRLIAIPPTVEAPLVLTFDEHAARPFDSFLARLHAELSDAEGLDQAWQGKGGGTVARIMGCLALLDWSTGPSEAPPGAIGRALVEHAIALWTDYMRPHARAVLNLAAPDNVDRKARQVVRWLRALGVTNVSREDVRREALNRSVNAANTDQVLYRLRAAGIVKQVHYEIPSHGGRPPNRWEVNPRLIAWSAPQN